MIIITGAAGFIGSCLVSKLNSEGYYDLVLVDDFSVEAKNKNLEGKKFSLKVDRNKFFGWLASNHRLVQFIFHLGARTDTAETDTAVFDQLNLFYSQEVWKNCIAYGLPLVYASSAATYGAGELGYDDRHEIIADLKPLNAYGESKNDFDKWALLQDQKPYFWIGLKFFNVYGPNEYHKTRMASVVYHAFNQIKNENKVRLFKSHRADYQDGKQMRDFVYVKDVVNVLFYWLSKRQSIHNGIYNLGSGKADSFLNLVKHIFNSMKVDENVTFIDTPADIRDKYQYFTEANMDKLYKSGYPNSFCSLEDGVSDYVKNYLIKEKYY